MNLETVIAERKNKVIYRDGDRCVKVFNRSFSKADILNESLNQARVEDLGLNVPKILEVTSIDGKWAIVSEYVEGETLSHLMRDDPANTESYLEMMVDTQLLIHTKRSPLLSRRHGTLVQAYRKSEEPVNLAHPLGVTFRQIFVDRDDMDAFATESVQVDGHGRR